MASLDAVIVNDTGYLQIPSGTTAQRPSSPTTADLRYNTDLGDFEYYDGTEWIFQNRFRYIPNDLTLGCMLYLDIDHPQSYQTGSNTWTDIAQGIKFAPAPNRPAINQASGANYWDFDGANWWHTPARSYYDVQDYEKVDFGAEYTLVFWIYATAMSARKTIFEKAGYPGYTSYQTEIAVTWETGNYLTWYSRYNLYDSSSAPVMNADEWNMCALHATDGLTTAARSGGSSINGGALGTSYGNRSTDPCRPAGEIRIGYGYAGACDNGGIAAVMAWNRKLSANEMAVLYDCYKGRFGL